MTVMKTNMDLFDDVDGSPLVAQTYYYETGVTFQKNQLNQNNIRLIKDDHCFDDIDMTQSQTMSSQTQTATASPDILTPYSPYNLKKSKFSDAAQTFQNYVYDIEEQYEEEQLKDSSYIQNNKQNISNKQTFQQADFNSNYQNKQNQCERGILFDIENNDDQNIPGFFTRNKTDNNDQTEENQENISFQMDAQQQNENIKSKKNSKVNFKVEYKQNDHQQKRLSKLSSQKSNEVIQNDLSFISKNSNIYNDSSNSIFIKTNGGMNQTSYLINREIDYNQVDISFDKKNQFFTERQMHTDENITHYEQNGNLNFDTFIQNNDDNYNQFKGSNKQEMNLKQDNNFTNNTQHTDNYQSITDRQLILPQNMKELQTQNKKVNNIELENFSVQTTGRDTLNTGRDNLNTGTEQNTQILLQNKENKHLNHEENKENIKQIRTSEIFKKIKNVFKKIKNTLIWLGKRKQQSFFVRDEVDKNQANGEEEKDQSIYSSQKKSLRSKNMFDSSGEDKNRQQKQKENTFQNIIQNSNHNSDSTKNKNKMSTPKLQPLKLYSTFSHQINKKVMDRFQKLKSEKESDDVGKKAQKDKKNKEIIQQQAQQADSVNTYSQKDKFSQRKKIFQQLILSRSMPSFLKSDLHFHIYYPIHIPPIKYFIFNLMSYIFLISAQRIYLFYFIFKTVIEMIFIFLNIKIQKILKKIIFKIESMIITLFVASYSIISSLVVYSIMLNQSIVLLKKFQNTIREPLAVVDISEPIRINEFILLYQTQDQSNLHYPLQKTRYESQRVMVYHHIGELTDYIQSMYSDKQDEVSGEFSTTNIATAHNFYDGILSDRKLTYLNFFAYLVKTDWMQI